MSALQRYHELAAKVDAFFARVAARHGEALRCAAGCDQCCRVRLTVTGVEADAIRAGLATLPPGERGAVAAAAAAAPADRCAALAPDGRCRIYPWRPLVCRSQGVPVRLADGRGLPVVTACELNFDGGGGLGAVDAGDVLDQQTLSTVLAAVDAARAAEVGRPAGARVDLAAVLAGAG
ncbi:MAG: YkgJ family cysteine cluster protein [Deltaproteobacteria bacterium]|nr:MAG: YkgJ family cysteine cluster protein [Deltaproteobacteria bacterium]